MSLSFDATFYQSQRPDVYNAFIATAGSTGLTWAEFAQNHYNTFGRFEGSDPSASFSTSYYLTTYPDVAAAGVNPFDHFLASGAEEQRVPYSTFPASSFVPATYAAANPDLAAAGITSDGALYKHWVLHGQFENRTGAPEVDTPSNGTTYTLTTGLDTITGTAFDDTINGVFDNQTASNNTLNVADTIDGAAGTDSLNILVNDIGVADEGPTLTGVSNVEQFFVRNLDGGNLQTLVNAAQFTGETQLWNDRSSATGGVEFTNVGTGAAIGIKGDGTTSVGATDFTYATVTDAATIVIDGGVKGGAAITNKGNGPTAATISSTGAENTVGAVQLSAGATVAASTINATTNLTTGNITGHAANATMTISGAATTVAIGTQETAVDTIDASGLTAGGITVTMDGEGDTKITGGAGADKITTATSLTTGSVDAGAGTDRLIIGNATDVDTSTEAGKYTNFEELQTTFSQDMSLVSGITALRVGATAGATTFSQMNATQAAAVTIFGDINAAGTTFALANSAGTTDVFTATLGDNSTTAGTSVDADTLTVNGFETINLTSVNGSAATAGANRTSVVEAFNADVATAINLTGTAFNLENAATTKAVTIDASALTGDGDTTVKGLTIAGSLVAGSTVTGSAFVDTVTVGLTGSTYNTGAGNDVISGAQAAIAGTTIDGGADTDTVNLTDAPTTTNTLTVNDATFNAVSNVEAVGLTGAIAGSLAWTVGGFANAIATANSGVLTVTAADVASGATADTITFDASGLGAGNAVNLTLTNTVATGAGNAGTDTFTGSDGNDTFTINYDANNANDNSVVTITGGKGDDTITFTMGTGTSAPGTITLSGGAGADTIVGSAEIDTITGGAGIDTLTGNGGVDIFVYTTATDSNAATAGAIDKITDFVGGGDQLQVGAAGGNARQEALTIGYDAADTIAELNALLNSTNGTATTARFDGTGADIAQLTLNDGRVLAAIDVNADGTFTAADVVVEVTGITGNIASGDVIV